MRKMFAKHMGDKRLISEIKSSHKLLRVQENSEQRMRIVTPSHPAAVWLSTRGCCWRSTTEAPPATLVMSKAESLMEPDSLGSSYWECCTVQPPRSVCSASVFDGEHSHTVRWWEIPMTRALGAVQLPPMPSEKRWLGVAMKARPHKVDARIGGTKEVHL